MSTRKIFFMTAIALAIVGGMTAPAFAQTQFFWTGAIDNDMTKLGNWAMYDGTADGAPATVLPVTTDDIINTGRDPYSWADTNLAIQPVLVTDWADIRQLVMMGSSSFTVTGNGQIRTNRRESAIRYGSVLHVESRPSPTAPAFIGRTEFYLGNNGTASLTTTTILRIDNEGYVQFERDAASTGILMGGATKALIEVRDNGKLELLAGSGFDFRAGYDPNQNKVVLSGNGQIFLYPTPAPPADPIMAGWTPAFLDSWIDAGLITTDDPGCVVTYSGTNPTILSVITAPPVDARAKTWEMY